MTEGPTLGTDAPHGLPPAEPHRLFGELIAILALPFELPPDSAGEEAWRAFAELSEFESVVAGALSTHSGGRPIDPSLIRRWHDMLAAQTVARVHWPERVARLGDVIAAVESGVGGPRTSPRSRPR